jgi:enoyl-[acyl-carrier protein] reductase I
LWPLLEGKNALVMGVADRHSIAWGIARAFAAAGARLVLTYRSERALERIKKLTPKLECPVTLVGPCDVQSDQELDRTFETVAEVFAGKLDVLVHSIAHAEREDLRGRFVDTSRSGFQSAQDISSYSLIACTQRARPLLEATGGGSVITLSYLGAERVVPNYNLMGVAKAALEANVRYLAYDLGPARIRVNAISAGPIKTLAAVGGITGFNKMLELTREQAPLPRNIDLEEIGDVAVFLASEMARGITGDVLYVDSGYHILGVSGAEDPRQPPQD